MDAITLGFPNDLEGHSIDKKERSFCIVACGLLAVVAQQPRREPPVPIEPVSNPTENHSDELAKPRFLSKVPPGPLRR